MINNRLYIGEVAYHGEVYAGEHEGIISRDLWDQVHAILETNNRQRPELTRVQTSAPLKGIIRCCHCNRAMRPSFTRKAGGRIYRYYTCQGADKNGRETCPTRTVAAGEVERVVFEQVRGLLRTPEVMVQTFQAMDGEEGGTPERKVMESLRNLETLWDELFPLEQARLLQLMVGKVDVSHQGIEVHLRAGGLKSLLVDLEQDNEGRDVA